MRFPSTPVAAAPPALRAQGLGALFRWLIVLLMVFDQLSAPWHPHHHDSGIDGTVAAQSSAHSDAHLGDLASATLAEAPDDPHLWAHATTLLRSEVEASLAAPGEIDQAPVPLWPAARLAPAVDGAAVPLVVVSQREPTTPAYRSLPPAAQAPPRRA